jgi:hypothetical protein
MNFKFPGKTSLLPWMDFTCKKYVIINRTHPPAPSLTKRRGGQQTIVLSIEIKSLFSIENWPSGITS